jgi:hypothetical protein
MLVERTHRRPARPEVVAMRRLALVVVLVLAAGVWPAAGSLAGGATATQAAPPATLQADFNNDGADDLAVGIPGQDIGSPPFNSGAVNVLYGSATGLSATGSQLFTQESPGVPGTPEEGDSFGDALATGDFDGDGFADLVVAAPSEGVGTAGGAGAVNVLYGSAGGLTATGAQLLTQVGGTPEPGDGFGWALTAGDFDDDGFADLAAAAPFEVVGFAGGAGAVSVLYGSAGGLTTTGGRLFSQVGGAVEAGDWFGFAVAAGDFDGDGAADLAAGAPFETVGSLGDAGAVSAIYGSANGLTTSGGQLFTQVGGTVEPGDAFGWTVTAGDFDGNGLADLAAAAPFEGVGATANAGAVSILQGSAGGLTAAGGQLFTQAGNPPEGFDQFGLALTAGDFNGNGLADLAAGVQFEDVGATANAGAVSILYGSAGGLTSAGGQHFTQVGGTIEAGDEFGFAVAAGDFDADGAADLAAGAPFEAVGSILDAGAVSAIYGSTDGLTTSGGQVFTQDTPGVPGVVEDEDRFGDALASGDPGPATAPAAGSARGPRAPRPASAR